ncbi:MAG: Gfo/Idh/MocA family oxidoreductase [Candidatus Riflebacteria bacterium]|nr:Gfo/Idh/MocA family oxidoreductase [Candidatus Riflebacteria bacterium]
MYIAGIIGLGVGEAHIEGYESHPMCSVDYLCDFDEKKVRQFAEKYPQKKVLNNADLLLNNPDIDIVSIASFDNFHHRQIVKAVRNKKHVFVEKPVCLFPLEAMDIKNHLDANPGIQISSNLILRKYPRFADTKYRIQNDELGKVYHIEADYDYGRIHKITEGWRGKLDFYSVVYGGGIHVIDLVLWLTGFKVCEVFAYSSKICTENTGYKYSDMVVALMKFENGATAKITANFGCVVPHFHGLKVYGTKGTIVNQKDCLELIKSRNPEMPSEKLNIPYPGAKKGDFLNDFVESVHTGKAPAISQSEIFSAMSVCFAIEESCKFRRPVEVFYI